MDYIQEEWLKNLNLYNLSKKKVTPKDSKKYFISNDVFVFTNKVLAEYGSLIIPNEGFVYWGGKINHQEIIINAAFAPDTISTKGSVEIRSRSNYDFVLFLSSNKLNHIANIHSHAGSWVGHSTGDDLMAPFKKLGLISIVVPSYGTMKKIDLIKCGVHRFDNNLFSELSTSYKKDRFRVIQIKSVLVDAREKNSSKWK